MTTSQGMVVRAKMKGTVVVVMEHLVKDPQYKKFYRQRTRVKARDTFGCKEGDLVTLAPTRPLASTVNWRIVKVVGRRQLPEAAIETEPS